MSDAIDDILGPGGAVARRIGERYEPREQQLEMARAVRRAMTEGKHLLAEAGTGVGKSFAYLVPAIELATKQKKRVVISTHTISLQEQLIEKDIPLLASLYPDEFTAVLVKGRNNYLCRRRLDAALTNRQMLFDENRQIESLLAIDQWAKKSTDGSLATLPVLPDPGVWDEVKAEHGNCLGKRCEFFENCGWQAAKRRMNTGNILVVNHALFFSDLALRSAGVNYLPKYDAVIFDEAHTIEDVAGQHFAVKLSETSLRYQLRQLYDPRKGKGVLSLQGKVADNAITSVVDAVESAQIFFDECAIWQQQEGRSNGRITQPDIVQTDLGERLNDVAKLIRAMLVDIKAPEVVVELTSKADRLAMTAMTVDVLMKQQMPDAVYWIDTQKQRVGRGVAQRVTLSAAPVDVSAGLRMHLFDRTKSVVMTSATLCTSKAQRAAAAGWKKIDKANAAAPLRGTGYQPVIPPASRSDDLQIRKGAYLPHWTKRDAVYAVNFRLADSLPAHVVADAQEASDEVDAKLDEGLGECWLRDGRVARLIQDQLKHFSGERYRLLAWSVMPNHVHAVIQPLKEHQLPDILHSWKSYTASQANKVLNRSGAFWQPEYYDHLVRDEEDLGRQVRYAAENPESAGLEDWPWSGSDQTAIDEVLRGEPASGHGLVTHATADQQPASSSQDAKPKRPEDDTRPRVPAAFAYIARRLGVVFADTIQLGSPFDYATQATLYVESGMPDPTDTPRFIPAVCTKVEQYVRHTHGGAFVLFTSYAMLRDVAERLKPTFEHLGLPVLIQGVDGNARQLIQRFRELNDCVLFGTSSFWQGIDVQGSKLRNVILTKLPFAVPDEPLIEAKLEAVTKTGGNAFMDLSLPEAIIRFKQGFGRLIRSRSDKGIVVVLDPRVKTKRYGKMFLDALPDVRVIDVRD